MYWASMTGSVQKVYYSKTRDFRNFSEPQMFIDNGNDHIIDTTILRDSQGNYYPGFRGQQHHPGGKMYGQQPVG